MSLGPSSVPRPRNVARAVGTLGKGIWLTVALADVRRIETSRVNWIVPVIVGGVIAVYDGIGLGMRSFRTQ
jgi:hypothetical protein